MYTIPKEIKSETRIYKNIYFKDFLICISVMGITLLIENLVYSGFKMIFYFVVAFITLVCVLPSKDNRKRKVYHSVLYSLKKDNSTYHPINKVSRINKGGDRL